MPTDDAQSALDALFWRDEILQVLFWMQGEGLVDAVDASDLRVLLNGETDTIAFHLDKMAGEGLLVRQASGDGEPGVLRYVLSEQGREEAGRRFADAFEGMQKMGHGECSPDCVCQWEGPAACTAHHHHQRG